MPGFDWARVKHVLSNGQWDGTDLLFLTVLSGVGGAMLKYGNWLICMFPLLI